MTEIGKMAMADPSAATSPIQFDAVNIARLDARL